MFLFFKKKYLNLQSDSRFLVHNSTVRRVLSRKRQGSSRRAKWGKTHDADYGWERETGHRRRLSRFVLDVSESRKFSNSVLNLATVDAPGVIISLPVAYFVCKNSLFTRVCLHDCYIVMLIISAWALALSVQQNWAMREPWYVGRTTDDSTLFVPTEMITWNNF